MPGPLENKLMRQCNVNLGRARKLIKLARGNLHVDLSVVWSKELEEECMRLYAEEGPPRREQCIWEYVHSDRIKELAESTSTTDDDQPASSHKITPSGSEGGIPTSPLRKGEEAKSRRLKRSPRKDKNHGVLRAMSHDVIGWIPFEEESNSNKDSNETNNESSIASPLPCRISLKKGCMKSDRCVPSLDETTESSEGDDPTVRVQTHNYSKGMVSSFPMPSRKIVQPMSPGKRKVTFDLPGLPSLQEISDSDSSLEPDGHGRVLLSPKSPRPTLSNIERSSTAPKPPQRTRSRDDMVITITGRAA